MITITSATSFAASGAVLYTVAANSSGVTRTGHLTVAGQTFTVTQVAGCSFTLDTTSLVVPWQGQQRMLQLTASSPAVPGPPTRTRTGPSSTRRPGRDRRPSSTRSTPAPTRGAGLPNLYIGGQTLALTEKPQPGGGKRAVCGPDVFRFPGRQPTAAELSAQLAALAGGSLSWTRPGAESVQLGGVQQPGALRGGGLRGILGRDAGLFRVAVPALGVDQRGESARRSWCPTR